jgi:hypothetical protein
MPHPRSPRGVLVNVVETECPAVTGSRKKDTHALIRHGLDPPIVNTRATGHFSPTGD